MIRKLTAPGSLMARSIRPSAARLFCSQKDEDAEDIKLKMRMQREMKDKIDQRIQEDLAKKAGSSEGFKAVRYGLISY